MYIRRKGLSFSKRSSKRKGVKVAVICLLSLWCCNFFIQMNCESSEISAKEDSKIDIETLEISFLNTEDTMVEEETIQKDPDKVVYLTFDDGPRADTTAKVLDILKDHDMKATFFLVAQNVEKNPDLTKRIVAEGHSIGVHCYDHTYETIYQSVDAYMDDFYKASDIIEEATGIRPRIFRFPGGSKNNFNRNVYQDIIARMEAEGYIYYDWNGSIEDTVKGVTRESLLSNTQESIELYPHLVFLAHDIIPLTADTLPEIIDLLAEYNFKTIQETDIPVQF